MKTVLSFLLFLVVVACTSSAAAPSPGEISIVTTTTVFADLVENVAGDRASVRSLVPKGGDIHTFDPAPSDAATISDADLLVMNGLGLDDWLESFAVEAAAGDIPLLELGVDLEGVDYIEGGEHHEHEDDEHAEDDHAEDDRGGVNPHVWMNPAYAALYVDRIAERLAQIDPAGADSYAADAAAYRERLMALHEQNRDKFADVGPENRRIVSFHDAFPYFAAAYGLEVAGVVVDAPGQDPSAGEIAALIDAMRSADVRVILSESQFSDDLVRTLSQETGVAVVSELYTDTLGDPPVDTYEGAITYDVDQIVAAMR